MPLPVSALLCHAECSEASAPTREKLHFTDHSFHLGRQYQLYSLTFITGNVSLTTYPGFLLGYSIPTLLRTKQVPSVLSMSFEVKNCNHILQYSPLRYSSIKSYIGEVFWRMFDRCRGRGGQEGDGIPCGQGIRHLSRPFPIRHRL